VGGLCPISSKQFNHHFEGTLRICKWENYQIVSLQVCVSEGFGDFV